jgi:hypothetical protein
VILNKVVPQEGHLPWIALRPFLKVTVLVEVISLFFLSFTQKARVMIRNAASLDIRWAVQLCILSYEDILTYQCSSSTTGSDSKQPD